MKDTGRQAYKTDLMLYKTALHYSPRYQRRIHRVAVETVVSAGVSVTVFLEQSLQLHGENSKPTNTSQSLAL